MDGKGRAVILTALASQLVRGSGADGGVEGDVVAALVGRAGLDVAASLAVGTGRAASASGSAREPVQRRMQPPWFELRADGHRHFLSPNGL